MWANFSHHLKHTSKETSWTTVRPWLVRSQTNWVSINFVLDPTKFFGCELGAQTQIDLKNERYIVNGSHNAEKLQEILDSFIEKFVLCPGCENPETNLVS